MKRLINIGIGEFVVSNTNEVMLATYAIGSCVAIILSSKNKVTSAMIHSVMPTAGQHAWTQYKRGYFVDRGLAKMIKDFMKATDEPVSHILCWVVGGGSAKSFGNIDQIGRKNVEQALSVLKKMDIKVMEMIVGGHKSRTVFFDVDLKTIKIQQQDVMI